MNDMQSEERFRRLNWLASELLDVPMSLIGLVASETVIWHGPVGLHVEETTRPCAFVEHTMLHDGVFLVPDANKDPRFSDHSLVTGAPFVRCFAGMRLRLNNGVVFGALCVMDTEPRIFRAREIRTFEGLAQIAEDIYRLFLFERQSH
ncbi:GAF domain-containing protein [Herbaspirillum seropedicae]|uniref:GAF domain-containing protein n=1 Tax=Herbaspirillum seropedicae TaxID=964 RepID=UPI003D963C60